MEADRTGRCGGGMSVFFGEGGLWVVGCCAGDRNEACLRGEDGAKVDAAPFVEEDAFALLVEEIFNAPGRIRLWRRVGADAVIVAVTESFFSSPALGCACLFDEVSSRGLFSLWWDRTSAGVLPSSRTELFLR